MCCFAQPVVSVTDTNIFARLESDGWQHLVYQMKFQSQKSNAIILPLPVKLPAQEANSLEFISLKGYKRFFDDLNKGFPLAPVESKKAEKLDSRDSVAGNSILKVHKVGDFIGSFVPSISDFERLDEQFRIPKETWDLLPSYSDYGFAVFQLRHLGGKPHPMAFKFQSRLESGKDASIFFPTVHIHDGKVHDLEEFDHSLFLQAPSYDEACGNYKQETRLVTDPATGYVRSKWTAEHFCNIGKSKSILKGDSLVHRLEIHGLQKNRDILAKLDIPKRVKTLFGLGPIGLGSAAIVAGLAGIVGMSWFFNRRDNVSTKRDMEKNES